MKKLTILVIRFVIVCVKIFLTLLLKSPKIISYEFLRGALILIAGIVAFAVGLSEAFLLNLMLSSFTSGDYTKAITMLLIKLFSYGAATAVLVLFFSDYIINCVIGYGIGLPIAVIIWFIYKSFFCKKAELGDDLDENTNNN